MAKRVYIPPLKDMPQPALATLRCPSCGFYARPPHAETCAPCTSGVRPTQHAMFVSGKKDTAVAAPYKPSDPRGGQEHGNE